LESCSPSVSVFDCTKLLKLKLNIEFPSTETEGGGRAATHLQNHSNMILLPHQNLPSKSISLSDCNNHFDSIVCILPKVFNFIVEGIITTNM
jgi:hypothetical protein